MGMHPELKHALDSGVSILEVIELFKKHHHCPEEEQIDLYAAFIHSHDHRHRCSGFWDTGASLLWCLDIDRSPVPIIINSETPLDIHKALTREVISWVCDSERKSNVYLIAEPRLQLYAYEHSRDAALADICSNAQRFGNISLCRNSSSNHGINSVIAELAVSYRPFRRILTRILIDNPGILESPSRTYFKKLIHEPWKTLQESHPQYATTPPVIVLRWNPKKYGDELFRSICEFGSLRHSSPLLWIISVDTRFRIPFQDLLHPLLPFHYFRLPICYNEGPADAELVLHHKFSAFRLKHEEIFGDNEVWPSQQQMSQLIRIVSGVLEFVDVIIQFVDWTGDGGPRAHLETFLAYMLDSPSPSDEQPYCSLDHFYIHALSNIPPDLFSVVKKAFSTIRHRGELVLDPIDLVCMLSLGNDSFLPHLERLAVITLDGRYYHSTLFKRFLQDPNRSGHFYTPKSESRLHAFQTWLNFILSNFSCLTTILKSQPPQWVQVGLGTCGERIEHLLLIAFTQLRAIQDAGVEWTSLRHFDFSCLAYACGLTHLSDFSLFLRELHAWDDANPVNIVRVEPVGPLDRKFIDACQGLAEPLDLEEEVYYVWSTRRPKYVLLGYESETVLAVLAPRIDNSDMSWITTTGVDIYTSAMLDYM